MQRRLITYTVALAFAYGASDAVTHTTADSIADTQSRAFTITQPDARTVG